MSTVPRVFISAARKSSGKTTISAGLCGALTNRGLSVQTFKKGPDYIDPMWLRKLSNRPCFNLDFNTQTTEEIKGLCNSKLTNADFGLIEGNKGLFDGVDLHGADSNAALAKLIQTPVILVIDAEGSTRGIAPLLNGYAGFDTDIKIGGVILNNIGGQRHESKLRAVVEHYTDIRVLGAVQRNSGLRIEERHLGLTTDREDEGLEKHIESITAAVEKQVDVDAIIQVADKASEFTGKSVSVVTKNHSHVRLGVALDNAFCFYYPDDLEAFRSQGAKLVYFDTLSDQQLPDVDALFIGGGFPETHARKLEANQSIRRAIKRFIESGKPVYAECGGLMYLSQQIEWQGKQYEMVGAIQGKTVMSEKPVGRGHVKLRPTPHHPWHGADADSPENQINAHEFHYSRILDIDHACKFAYAVERGYGIDGQSDGLVAGNIFATYAHMRNTVANPWVGQFIAAINQAQSR